MIRITLVKAPIRSRTCVGGSRVLVPARRGHLRMIVTTRRGGRRVRRAARVGHGHMGDAHAHDLAQQCEKDDQATVRKSSHRSSLSTMPVLGKSVAGGMPGAE